ncbi:hypothetical protein KCA24_26170, partial [Escherichia coli]|nr:hypothetical protein [Escherichia coli]
RVIFEGQQQKLINSLRNMQLCMLLKKRKILTNSKVVFYMHLQWLKEKFHSGVFFKKGIPVGKNRITPRRISTPLWGSRAVRHSAR